MAEAKKVMQTKKEESKDGVTKESTAATTQTDQAAEALEAKDTKTTAKAGKRSAKALKEVEEKQAKESRKATNESEEPKPNVSVKPARSRLERRGKKYRDATKLVDRNNAYSLREALELAAKTSTTKFDASIEMHIRLGVDPKHADQNIRDNLVLPAGTGKQVRVAVFAEVDDVKKAKDAGADIAGSDEFLQQLDKGTLDFDVLIATPAMMAKLGKYARVLGPKGLMPNPKSGTVTPDVSKAVKEAKAGRVEYRVDSTGIVHLGVGKVSFGADKLEENARAVLTSIKSNKPASVKGNYVRSIFVASAMGPSIKVLTAEL